MKTMKKSMVLLLLFGVTFTIVGCTSEQNSVEQAFNENHDDEMMRREQTSQLA